jgi:hypothetical protein
VEINSTEEELSTYTIMQIPIPPSGVIPNHIFETYWNFASERQRVFWKRKNGEPGPWSEDPILQTYKFTNTYRVLDRVSQYLLRNIIVYPECSDLDCTVHSSPENTIFRIMFFKLFNRPETWEMLSSELGEEPHIDNFNFTIYDETLTSAQDRGEKIYSNAYMMTAAGSNGDRRHRMYLRLYEKMFHEDKIQDKILEATSLEALYNLIRTYRTMGPFLAMQYAIDLNYSPFVNFLETDFIIAGPGARRGILKCFDSIGNHNEADVIRWVQETQDEQFMSRGLEFKKIGNRPLQLIDCQSLFCEVDKFTRASNPEIQVETGSGDAQKRARIKQNFKENSNKIEYVFPSKWGVKI